MCKMVLNSESERNMDAIVYNIAMSECSGKFTVDGVHENLKTHGIEIEKSSLKDMFTKWLDAGMIRDDLSEYVLDL